jgi:hypothetical protein
MAPAWVITLVVIVFVLICIAGFSYAMWMLWRMDQHQRDLNSRLNEMRN